MSVTVSKRDVEAREGGEGEKAKPAATTPHTDARREWVAVGAKGGGGRGVKKKALWHSTLVKSNRKGCHSWCQNLGHMRSIVWHSIA